MSDNTGKEQDNAKRTPESTPYERMSHELQLKWEERLFNILKMRNMLLDAESAITYAYLVWTRFAMLVTILLAIDPERFPLRKDFCFALAAFFVYYVLIGFMRRQTEKNLASLCAQHPDPAGCVSGKLFKDRQQFVEENDPPLAQRFFKLRGKLGIPRRGAAQKEIIKWQFIVPLCYIGNYVWYVMVKNAPASESSLAVLWLLQVTMTAGGILALFKNFGLLVDTNRLLKNIEGLAGSILGRGRAIGSEGYEKTPCAGKEKT
jgi:hypothetical protein